MNINKKTHVRDGERRKKRFFVPIVYFLAEVILLWLALSLIQVKFFVTKWDIWAIIVFFIGAAYSITKTVHVFQRQKDYPE